MSFMLVESDCGAGWCCGMSPQFITFLLFCIIIFICNYWLMAWYLWQGALDLFLNFFWLCCQILIVLTMLFLDKLGAEIFIWVKVLHRVGHHFGRILVLFDQISLNFTRCLQACKLSWASNVFVCFIDIHWSSSGRRSQHPWFCCLNNSVFVNYNRPVRLIIIFCVFSRCCFLAWINHIKATVAILLDATDLFLLPYSWAYLLCLEILNDAFLVVRLKFAANWSTVAQEKLITHLWGCVVIHSWLMGLCLNILSIIVVALNVGCVLDWT